MPMYQYLCDNPVCPEPDFESLEKMDTQTIACRHCPTGTATKKETSPIRQSGWYANAASVRFHFNFLHN